MQPWGLSGSEFLAVYSTVFVVSVLLLIVPRYTFGFGAEGTLTYYQAAFLIGGAGRVLLTGCADLLESGRAWRAQVGGLAKEGDFTAGGSIEAAIVEVMSAAAPWHDRTNRLRRDPAIDELKAELRASGLMMTQAGGRYWRAAVFLPVVIWLVGVARMINDAIVHQPIGDLITLLLISMVAVTVLYNRVMYLGVYATPRCAVLIRRLRRGYAEEARAGNDPGTIDFYLTGVALIGLSAANVQLRKLVGKATKYNAGLGTDGDSWLTSDPS